MEDWLTQRIGANEVKALAEAAKDSKVMDYLVEKVHSLEPREAWNAAWTLTHFDDEQISRLLERRDEFIDLAMQTDNVSLRRLMLTIVERMPMDKANFRTDFLDFCLEHMALPSEAAGIQSLCMKMAHRQCSIYPELLPEFISTLSLMQDGYAKCVMHNRNKFLKEIL